MGYENDPYMDEDGEPLMDPDMPSDREPLPKPMVPIDDDDEGDWRQERFSTPVLGFAAEDKGRKPRKKLVKKSGKESSLDRGGSPAAAGLDGWEEDELSERKRKKALSLKEGKSASGGKGTKRKSSSSKVEWLAKKALSRVKGVGN